METRKLGTQLPIRLLALVCALGPFAFAGILSSQSGTPSDTLFGFWVHSSGFAIPLVVLGFAGTWGFPVIAGVVAGDLFSSEDRYGTWKTVLTRSCRRRDVFWGKLLTAAAFSVSLVTVTAISSVLAGLLLVGDGSLVSLSGTLLSPGRALGMVLASWLVSIPPVLAFTAIAVLFSVLTRNGIMGVLGPSLVGLVMQLLALTGKGVWVHMALVGSAFDDWHGLLTAHPYFGPLVVALVVSLVWTAACIAEAWWNLRLRDFAGIPVARRTGWAPPVLAFAGTAIVIAIVAVAANWGPVGITASRLDASIKPAFNRLYLLGLRELGHQVPAGFNFPILSSCNRRSNHGSGPGDDWICTFNLLTPQPGAVPYQTNTLTYDLSVKANGCYKAEAPAAVGQQTLPGRNIANPIFTIYGCFNPL